MKKLVKALLISIIAAVLAASAFAAYANIHMVSYARKYIADDLQELGKIMDDKADAAIVFGAYVYDSGRPCPMLEDRLVTGSRVYDSGLAPKMLLSGDHGTRGYDEVNAMKRFILDAGYPKDDVFLDHAGFSTYDTVLRAIKVFEIKKAVLSTQEYHLVRAVYIARKNGMEAWGISSDLRPYPKSQMTRYIIREWLARAKDFAYVNILKPDPVFLGEKIPITGGSGPSYDE